MFKKSHKIIFKTWSPNKFTIVRFQITSISSKSFFCVIFTTLPHWFNVIDSRTINWITKYAYWTIKYIILATLRWQVPLDRISFSKYSCARSVSSYNYWIHCFLSSIKNFCNDKILSLNFINTKNPLLIPIHPAIVFSFVPNSFVDLNNFFKIA